MLAIINNVAPYLEQLSPTASTKLTQLFVSMSSPSFLLANETNHDLLRAILEIITAIVEHQPESILHPVGSSMTRGKLELTVS